MLLFKVQGSEERGLGLSGLQQMLAYAIYLAKNICNKEKQALLRLTEDKIEICWNDINK
jgi:hypothetical protein